MVDASKHPSDFVGARVVLDRALGAGTLVVLRQQLHATRADARIEVATEQDVLVDLVHVLDLLDVQEGERAQDRHGAAADQAGSLIELRASHAPRCREAREDQHGGVDRAELHVQPLVGVAVDLRVVDPIQDVRDEQRREEQHFLREEQPDPELAGVELVLGVVVVVLDEPRAVMAVVVVRRAHDFGSSGFLSSAGRSFSAVSSFFATIAGSATTGCSALFACSAGVVSFGVRRSHLSGSTSIRSS